MIRSRISCLIIAGVACAGLAAARTMAFAPCVVWNGSASAPEGLYFIERRVPRRGEFALVTPRKEIALFIEERRYLPPDTPLIKRVAAVSDDKICRDGGGISVNEIHVATALSVDSIGREMPRWSGCFTLQKGEIFLLNDHENSLDGRYFGATKAVDVIGVAKPVWVRRNER